MGLFSCLSPEAFDLPRSDTLVGQTASQTRSKPRKDRRLGERDKTCRSDKRAHSVSSPNISLAESVDLPPSNSLSLTSLRTPSNAPSRKSQISSLFSLSPSPSPSLASSSPSSCSPRPVVVHLSMVGRDCEWENDDKQPKRLARPRLGRSLTAPPITQTLDEKHISCPILLASQPSDFKGRKRSLSTVSISGPRRTRPRTRSRRSESNLSSDCPYPDLTTIASLPNSNPSSIVFQMDFDRPQPLVSSHLPLTTSSTTSTTAESIDTFALIQDGPSRSRTVSIAYPFYAYNHSEFDLSPLSTDLTTTPDLVSFSSCDKSSSSFYPSPESSPEISWYPSAQSRTEQTSPERRLAALAALIMDAPTPRTSFEAEDPVQSMVESERFPVRPLSTHLDFSDGKNVAFEPSIQGWASSTTKTVAQKPRAMIKNVNGLKAEWRKNREAATWGEELTWEFIKAVNEGR